MLTTLFAWFMLADGLSARSGEEWPWPREETFYVVRRNGQFERVHIDSSYETETFLKHHNAGRFNLGDLEVVQVVSADSFPVWSLDEDAAPDWPELIYAMARELYPNILGPYDVLRIRKTVCNRMLADNPNSKYAREELGAVNKQLREIRAQVEQACNDANCYRRDHARVGNVFILDSNGKIAKLGPNGEIIQLR